jgi:hypothetical protein
VAEFFELSININAYDTLSSLSMQETGRRAVLGSKMGKGTYLRGGATSRGAVGRFTREQTQ